MANSVKAIQVGLQQDGFCIITGPDDSALVYPHKTSPFAPVLLDSPVVAHLYYPELFPDEVLKVHAEHLGHFLALQSVPKIDDDLERALFRGLCATFGEEAILKSYNAHLTGNEGEDDDDALVWNTDADGNASSPRVFASFAKSKAPALLALLRELAALFDVTAMKGEIEYRRDQEPCHMLFLYLIQLMAVFVSSSIGEIDLATLMSVASAVFLETNHAHPLCAATILKPMFVPYYKHQWHNPAVKSKLDGDQDCESRLVCYRLFTGYELDDTGADVGSSGGIRWTEQSLLDRTQGACSLVERNGKKLWFVAPQYGDRLAMTKDRNLKLMGGQTGARPAKIASVLVSDNVLAYMQCAMFGTIRNMLACHDNSDLSENVMEEINGSMYRFAKVVRHQSANLLQAIRCTDSCMYVTGVGFSGQDSGTVLQFGKVYTGSEEKKPQAPVGFGVFTSVVLGVGCTTMMTDMINAALDPECKSTGVHGVLATEYKPVLQNSTTISEMYMYGRYHHWFNNGEFTEVANVKCLSDHRYNSLVHADCLKVDSKYQLTTSHGALPMCLLTLAMTMRQTVIMTTGFFCAELARVSYGAKATDTSVCRSVSGLGMFGKFKITKSETTDTMTVPYGELLKFSGPVFSNCRQRGDLNKMEWLDPEDQRLPEYIRKSLNVIGGTRKAVEAIMAEKTKSYNRVLFLDNKTAMSMPTMYENEEYMVHAPLMIMCTMRIFSTSSKSHASCKLSKKACFYIVKVFSNRCVDAKLHFHGQKDLDWLSRPTRNSVSETVDKIKREVSCVLPRIHINRMKMIAPEMTADDFSALVAAVKAANIEVLGEEEGLGSGGGLKRAYNQSCSTGDTGKKLKVADEPTTSTDDCLAVPSRPAPNIPIKDTGLTIYDGVDFGSDDSD